MFSFFLLAPVALLVEGPVFLPSRVAAMGVQDPQALFKSATIAAATFHLYQQVSYMILARVSPVTHSIGNCVKRCACPASRPDHHLPDNVAASQRCRTDSRLDPRHVGEARDDEGRFDWASLVLSAALAALVLDPLLCEADSSCVT